VNLITKKELCSKEQSSFLVIFILTGPIRLALISKVLETFIFLGKLRTYKFLYIYYIKI